MSVFKWGIVLLVIGIAMLIGYRLLIQFRINQIKQSADRSPVFQKKVLVFERKETGRHVQFLMISGIVTVVVLTFLTFLVFHLDNQRQIMGIEMQILREEIHDLKENQKKLYTETSLRDYPDEGIDLAKFAWKELLDSKTPKEKQYMTESALANELKLYFGETTVLLAVDVPTQTISMTVTIKSDDMLNEELVNDNIAAFITELEEQQQIDQLSVIFKFDDDSDRQETLYVRNTKNKKLERVE